MHRAEQILQACKVILTGLTTTGSRVERDRVYPVLETPSISIEMRGESPEEEPTYIGEVASDLEVSVYIYVKVDSLSTTINQIKAEVYEALKTSNNLGLSFVEKITWEGDEAPGLSGEQETKTAVVECRYLINYVHSLTSKEN